MKEKNLKDIEEQVIKWFLRRDTPLHLKGFKYCTYILIKRLTEEWKEEEILNI